MRIWIAIATLSAMALCACKASPQKQAGASDADAPALDSRAAAERLELVAVGKDASSHRGSMTVLGARMWFASEDIELFADGDGPLARGAVMTSGLAYDPQKQTVVIRGRYPRLFALRTDDTINMLDPPHATAFVTNGNGWTQASPLGRDFFPQALVAWNDGLLLVDSQIALSGDAVYKPGKPGTTFTFVAADGSVTHPSFGLAPTFMAWSASADGASLSLLGTNGIVTKEVAAKGAVTDGAPGAAGLVLVRGKAGGAFRALTFAPDMHPEMQSYAAGVVESGVATAWFPWRYWDAKVAQRFRGSVFVLADGASEAVEVRDMHASVEGCGVAIAVSIGTVVYALDNCMGAAQGHPLVRADLHGKPEIVALPALAKKDGGGFRIAAGGAIHCVADEMQLRPPDDLWITAFCSEGTPRKDNAIPAVFRRGRPQEPVVLP